MLQYSTELQWLCGFKEDLMAIIFLRFTFGCELDYNSHGVTPTHLMKFAEIAGFDCVSSAFRRDEIRSVSVVYPDSYVFVNRIVLHSIHLFYGHKHTNSRRNV